MREFVTAVKRQHDQAEEDFKISIDGRECTYHYPTPGQYAVYMTNVGRHSTREMQISGTIDFMFGLFDDQDAGWLQNRLMSRSDDFELEQVTDLLDGIIEEWTGRPTKRPTVSVSSQTNDGPKSTPRTRKSTSSRSRSTDS